jgi:hypothetical protein
MGYVRSGVCGRGAFCVGDDVEIGGDKRSRD